MIRSDGFTMDFMFCTRKTQNQESVISQSDLSLEGFSIEEVVNTEYEPIIIDSGCKTVFTTSLGVNSCDIRRCTTKEYYHRTGSKKYMSKLQSLKNEFTYV
jgi:hypothetical protein